MGDEVKETAEERVAREAIVGTTINRVATIERVDDDPDSRRVELSFSSDELVRDSFGYSRLDHSDSGPNLEFFRSGRANVLINHNKDNVVGVVETVSVDRIGKPARGRAVARFGRTALAEDALMNIRDGILTGISVGASIEDIKRVGTHQDGTPIFSVTRWTPFEVSLTPVPADTNVGIGRNKITERTAPSGDSKMDENENVKKETVERTVDVDKIAREARENEVSRVQELYSLGRKHDMLEQAEAHAKEGKTVDTFRAYILDNLKVEPKPKAERSAPEPVKVGVDLSTPDVQRYSLLRAVKAQISGNWDNAGFEKEVSQAITQRAGSDPQGFYVPAQALMTRALDATTGAGLVGTETRADQFVEFLRAGSALEALGVTTMDDLVGNVDIPKQTAGGTFTWFDPDAADAATADAAAGTVELRPKHIGGRTTITRTMLKQSSPSAEQIARNDATNGIRTALTLALLQGTGASGQPEGVANFTNINTVEVAGTLTTPTYAEVVALQSALDSGDIPEDSRRFVANAAMYGALKTITKDSGSGIFILEDGEIDGELVVKTNNAPAGLMYGNWSSVVVGSWGTVDMVVDAVSSNRGSIFLKSFLTAGVAPRYEEAFSKLVDLV